jgi:hypothetical protein
MSNPSQQAQQLMSTLSGLLKQAQNDPDSVQIDIGEARKLKDLLSNILNAHDQQEQEGGKEEKGGKQSKSSSKEGEEDEENKEPDEEKEDDEEKEGTQKKSPLGQ